MAELFYAASDVAALLKLDQWEIVVNAAEPRDAKGADGQPVTIHDAVLQARRLIA